MRVRMLFFSINAHMYFSSVNTVFRRKGATINKSFTVYETS